MPQQWRQLLITSEARFGIKTSMVLHASTTTQNELFDGYVKKFRSLYDMHNIQFGSPDDLPVFMQKLQTDRHFAMDFWALTGTLSKREGGELSVDEMLAVIVIGVAGGDIPPGDEGHQSFVTELASLLAGVDLYSPSRLSDAEAVDPPVAAPVAPPGHPGSQTRFADMTKRAADEVPLPRPAPANVVESEPLAVESEPAPSPLAIVQHQLDEALMRLERNSIELKDHLDDLDQKMSRIEPHLEALTSKIYLAEPPRRPVEEPVIRPAERLVHKSAENPRLVLEPKPEPKEEVFADTGSDAFLRTPLSAYPQRTNHSGVMAAAIIFFALIVTGLILQQSYGSSIWQRAGETLRDKYDMVREKMHRSDAGQTATSTAANPDSIAAAGTAVASVGGSGIVKPVAPQTEPAATQAPPANNLPEQTAVEHAPSAASVAPSPAVSARANSPSSMKPTRASLAEAEETASPDRALTPSETANAIKVAPAVMEANLLASRVPVYPEAAKINHVEGPVVVQALISKYGFVDRVHVIEGNPRLRSAAAEAVQKWRYKPYLLNGTPVEVATTITVDFSLDEQ